MRAPRRSPRGKTSAGSARLVNQRNPRTTGYTKSHHTGDAPAPKLKASARAKKARTAGKTTPKARKVSVKPTQYRAPRVELSANCFMDQGPNGLELTGDGGAAAGVRCSDVLDAMKKDTAVAFSRIGLKERRERYDTDGVPKGFYRGGGWAAGGVGVGVGEVAAGLRYGDGTEGVAGGHPGSRRIGPDEGDRESKAAVRGVRVPPGLLLLRGWAGGVLA